MRQFVVIGAFNIMYGSPKYVASRNVLILINLFFVIAPPPVLLVSAYKYLHDLFIRWKVDVPLFTRFQSM